MKGIFIRIPESLEVQFTEACRREGLKKSGLLARLIQDYLNDPTARATPTDPILEAKRFGIDFSVIEQNLRKTPTERLRDHERAHAFVETLQKAKRIQKL